MSNYRIDRLEHELQGLVERLPAVRQAVIVSIDGFVIASYPVSDSEAIREGTMVDSPQVAAMASTLLALGEQALMRLSTGQVQRLIVEGDDGGLIAHPITSVASLTVLTSINAKLGLTVREVGRVSKTLAALL